MTLDRKDVRIKLDPDDHVGLHSAIVLADEAKRLGITGKPIPASV